MEFHSERTYACWHCQDNPSGWLPPMRCPDIACDRTQAHGPHTYTTRCPCWLERHAHALVANAQAAMQENKPTSAEYGMLADLRAGRYPYGSG